jgi:hypothetical protein
VGQGGAAGHVEEDGDGDGEEEGVEAGAALGGHCGVSLWMCGFVVFGGVSRCRRGVGECVVCSRDAM